VQIKRVDTALDAGTLVNPEMARQQFEGAAVMGTSLAFHGEITASNGAIEQSNFNDYQMARMKDAPRETYVHIVPSDAPRRASASQACRRLPPLCATRFLQPPASVCANCH